MVCGCGAGIALGSCGASDVRCGGGCLADSMVEVRHGANGSC